SEHLSGILKKKRVPHQVLNARFHEQEAVIIAQAGAPGAVTIATNMAGRGTDIQLGGNVQMLLRQELEGVEDPAEREARAAAIRGRVAAGNEAVKKAGGLFVIGTERHESRRIDNQLRGRSGRQGDPGRSRFFLSLEDDLMRIFGSDRMGGMLQKLGLKEGEAIVHPWINKALERAQKKVEARNFDTRKNVLKYDDVMNDQRKEVYAQRKEFMKADDVSETVAEMRAEVIANLISHRIPEKAFAEQWETKELGEDLRRIFALDLPTEAWGNEEGIAENEIRARTEKAADEMMAAKAANYGPALMRLIEKSLLIQTLDQVWKEHLLALDHLRQGIGLRAYGQRDPLNEYKAEGFSLFNAMLDELKERVTMLLSRVEITPEAPPQPDFQPRRQAMIESHPEPVSATAGAELELAGADAGPGPGLQRGAERIAVQPVRAVAVDPRDPATWAGTPRNAPCPCGSGKKFKHCHGRI
ncbi:MAG TPA: SEC-C metal-binding domain-containing protein, partial [Acetobacteraceae bacterium]|nr:SEC-C metal-binding domain-containing protein [Acetobacteraceae bacterium]